MANLFNSVNVALSALLSQQQSTQVIEHNVANVNTEGYHRQTAVLSASPAVSLSNSYYGTGVGQMGTGVLVTQIERYSVNFYNTRYRASVGDSSMWSAESDIISQLEATLSETTDNGLLTKLDEFFGSWQTAVASPNDLSVRRELLDSAKSLADAINLRANAMESLRAEQNLAISQRVLEINQLSSKVAELNQEISRITSIGDSPNDLLDERDLALDRLSEISGAISYDQPNGEVMVSAGGHVLVAGQESFGIKTEMDPTNDNLYKMVWADGKSFVPTTGELAGILHARDTVIKDQMDGLEDLTFTLMGSVNSIHINGYGLDGTHGEPFFSGTDAMSISVNSVLEEVEKIGFSSAIDEVGNSDIAQQIFSLFTSNTMASGTSTFNHYYNTQVSSLGLSVKKASANSNNQKLIASALLAQRESVSGVSLNEEAANLMKSQKAYEAAARLMTVIDEMLDTLINRMAP